MAGGASWSYNSKDREWQLTGKDGVVRARWGEDANIISKNTTFSGTVKTGPSGTALTQILKFVGTNALLSTVALAENTTGTITGAAGIAAGDTIVGVPKSNSINTGRLAIGHFFVPTTNVLNVRVVNIGTVAGSLPATGWDIVAIR